MVNVYFKSMLAIFDEFVMWYERALHLSEQCYLLIFTAVNRLTMLYNDLFRICIVALSYLVTHGY